MTVLLASALIAGCAVQRVGRTLDGLVGLDIHYAVNVLGYPASERTVLGDTIYAWYSRSTTSMPVFGSETTNGEIDGAPFSATTSTTNYVPLHFSCKIELATGPDHLIKHVSVEGNEGGCAHYERLLR